VLAVIDDPTDVRDDGVDNLGRDKWIFVGNSADGETMEIVIVIDQDELGNTSILVTLYFA